MTADNLMTREQVVTEFFGSCSCPESGHDPDCPLRPEREGQSGCNCGVSTGESACTDHAPDCPCWDAPGLGDWRRKPKFDGGQIHG
jgi:hypothetical protein